MKKISVLIPTFYRPYYLRQALESVINQTLKPYEVIVADDSTDQKKSAENKYIVESFSKKYPYIYYYKNEKNLGPSKNYKNLLELSSGDLINFLGDDDILSPIALERLSKPLVENENIKLSAGKTFISDKYLNFNLALARKFLRYYSLFSNKIYDGKYLILLSYKYGIINFFGSFSGFMFRKSDVNLDITRYKDYELRANNDIYLWLNLLKNGDAYLLKDYTNIFRYHGENEQIGIGCKGCEEKLIFYSNEFMSELGIDLEIRKQCTEFIQSNLKILLECQEYKKGDIVNRYIGNPNLTFNSDRSGFSIIIVTYKNEDTIQSCIESFIDTLTEKDEVIIIDNSPLGDLTENILKEMSEKYPSFLKFIKNSENVGYARAINDGVKIAKNEFLLFLNPDTEVVSKNWLNIFHNNLKEEDIGAVGAVSDIAFFKNKLSNYISMDLYRKLNQDEIVSFLQDIYGDKGFEFNLLSGFCVGTKKSIFVDRYGYFDENLILGYDDFDYSMFLVENGYKQLVIPAVFVKHKNHVSFNKEGRKAEKLNELSFNNFMKKLIKKYGYGNIPEPYEFFTGKKMLGNYNFFSYLEKGRFRFGFNFSNNFKNKEFFRKKAEIIKSKPKIAVVTVNYRSYEDVIDLAKSIVDNTYKNIDFVVVDNSEDDVEFENLRSSLKEIFIDGKNLYLLKNSNTGYAGGNNLGIKFAIENLNPAYIWLLNPDTVITDNTPIELVRTVEFTDVPVATCKMIDYHSKLCQYNGFKVNFDGINGEDTGIFRVSFLSGANIFMKRGVIDKIGYMDERFFLYFEDNEYFKRMLNNNIFPLYTPFTYIYHKGSKTTGGFLKNPLTVYYYVRNLLHWTDENT
ncbi:MAG: glycosyltransferase [Hydrogenothermaceae bacterium]